MAFSTSTHNLPAIDSFEHCEHIAGKRRACLTTRRRNCASAWSDNKLPLDDNRGKWSTQEYKTMRWVADGEDSRWALYYYHTEVVGYFRDGRVKLNATWDSISTRMMFEALCPRNVMLARLRFGLAYRIGCVSGDAAYHQVDRPIGDSAKWNQALIIDAQGAALNPQPWTTSRMVANRARRREIRVLMAPFTDWYNAMTRVGNSMAGVTAGDEGTLDRDAIPMMLTSLIERCELDDELWRRACRRALRLATLPWYRRGDGPTNIAHAAPVMALIMKEAFKLHGGYTEVVNVVPAGVRPF